VINEVKTNRSNVIPIIICVFVLYIGNKINKNFKKNKIKQPT